MIGNGLLRRAGALALVTMVMMSVAVCTATPPAQALPCTVPCEFSADNVADGLGEVAVDATTFWHATWWTIEPTDTTSLTVHADPDGIWAPVLVLTDADTNVVAAADTTTGGTATLTVTVQAGTVYLLALAGHDAADQGHAAMTLTTGTPDAPGDVGAAAFDAGAGVTWSAPDDHGDAVVEYRVYVNGSNTYTAVPAPATSTSFSGLTVGASYVFEVSAVNTHGESARSAPSAEVVVFGSTTTSISFTPSAPSWPNSFVIEARVTSSATVNSGSVNFFRNGTALGSVPVANGIAALPPQTLSPGAYTIVANYLGSSEFNASGHSRSITVGKGAQSITFTGIGSTAFATGTIGIAPTSSSGLAVSVASSTPTVCTVRTGVVTLVAGGTCSLTATQAGNAYWSAAAPVVRSFSVVDEPQIITFDGPADRRWSAETFTVHAASTSGLTVSFASATTDVCTVAGGEVTLHRTGTCTLMAVQDGDARWAAAQEQRSFDVEPAAPALLTTSVSADELEIGGHAVLSSIGGSGEGAISFEVVTGDAVCSVDGDDLTALTDGTCTVRARQAADTRYEANDADGATVTVLTQPPTTTSTSSTTPTTVAESTTTSTSTTTTTTTSTTTTVAPPPRPAMFTPVAAVRAADRRLRVGDVLTVQATGLAARVPTSGVGAVAVVVTVDGATAAGHLTAYPCGTRSTASMLNVTPGRKVSSSALVPVDRVSGRVCLVMSTTAHVTVDVTGWTAVAGGLHPVGPARVVDTRPGARALRNVPRRVLTPGVTLRVPVTGLAGLTPRDRVSAVVVHVTTVNATGPGHLTVWACGPTPRTSSVNFTGAQAVANLVVAGVAPGTGEVCISTSRATHVLLDLTGWIEVDRGFTALAARRVVDTRPGAAAPAPVRGRIEPLRTVAVRLADLGGAVPMGRVRAIAVNVTVIGGAKAGVVRLGACDGGGASAAVAFAAGQTVAGGAVLRIPAGDERWCITTTAAAHVVIDVSGWFDGGAPS